MTRTAVEEGFAHFLDEAIEETIATFSVARALRSGARGPASVVVDGLLKNSQTLHRKVVEPELQTYRRQTLDQFGVVLDYVDSGDELDAYRDDILETGALVDAIRSDLSRARRREVTAALLAHHRGLGEAVEPLLESPADDFWTAATAELTRAEAEALVGEHFAFTGPLRRHRDAFEMVTTVDPGAVLGGLGALVPTSPFAVEYTDEALRAMYRAEQSVIQRANGEIARRFG